MIYPEDENDSEVKICPSSGKRMYSYRVANEIINVQKHHKISNVRVNKNKIPKRSYYCTECKMYHLTSTSGYDKIYFNKKRRIKR